MSKMDKQVSPEVKAFTEELIDKFLDMAEDLNFAWHYGEESILVTDIVNLINNTAGTDYKRYGSGFLKEKWNPHNIDRKCRLCTQHFSRHEKKEHRNYCAGKRNASCCEKFKNVLDEE